MEGKRKVSEAEGLTFIGMKDGFALYEIVSGNYHFTSMGISGFKLN